MSRLALANNIVDEKIVTFVNIVETIVLTSISEQEVYNSSCEEMEEILNFCDVARVKYKLKPETDVSDFLVKSVKYN